MSVKITGHPRKDAVRAVLDVVLRYRKTFEPAYPGHHRAVASFVVDEVERLSGESKYVTRFLIEPGQVVALRRGKPAFVLDVSKVERACKDVLEPERWDTSVLGALTGCWTDVSATNIAVE